MVSNGEPETARLDEAAASYSATYSIPRKERRSSDLASHPTLTGPAWPAGSRGECPPVSACGGSLLLYFAPRAHRPRRARIAGLLESGTRSEEHTSELQSLMRISYAVFCLTKKTKTKQTTETTHILTKKKTTKNNSNI